MVRVAKCTIIGVYAICSIIPVRLIAHSVHRKLMLSK